MKFTVLLLRPDHVANNFGQDTWVSHVEADTPGGAVVSAQEIAYWTDHEEGDGGSADDYHPLFVVEGHLSDLTPEPWR
jgi:hypothetical protein